jgi:hypothetical protein
MTRMKNDSNDDTPTSRIIIALEMLTNDRVLKFYTSNTEKEGGGAITICIARCKESLYILYTLYGMRKER